MSWELGALLVLGVALAVGFAWYERSRPRANVLAVVAALAALAVIGRLAFAAFPNVKPTTDIVLIAGYGLGGAPGFAVGSITALASNFFLSQGPWTPWQMVAWGGVGIFGGLLARAMRGREPSRLVLALACAAAGAGFGILMDFYQWTLAAEQSIPSYLAIAGTSLPYNLAHVIGNFVFALIIGKPLLRALKRIRTRFDVRWDGPRRGAPAALTLLAMAVALMVPSLAVSKKDNETKTTLTGDAVTDATTWLRQAQNDDGGFGEDENKKSNQLFSAWAALAFAASGSNPASVSNGGKTLIEYIEKDAKKFKDAADLARTILLVEASGLDAEKFGGQNLVKELERERDGDGSYGGSTAPTAFAMLAQKAAGNRGGLKASSHWLADQANEDDGGFSVNSSGKSDVDVTASALQAMEASGEVDNKVRDDAIKFLKEAQNSNGGFGQFDGSESNSQSTAFAIQGLEAAGETPGDFGGKNDPIEYLEDQQDKKDGHIEYGGGRDQTPVWVTSQAILGLRQADFPLSELAKPLSTKEQNDLLKDNNNAIKTPKVKTPKTQDSITSTPLDNGGSNNSPSPSLGSGSNGAKLPKELRPGLENSSKTPELATPGSQAGLIPPAFTFGTIQPKPKGPSALTKAAEAASTATTAASAPGETVGTDFTSPSAISPLAPPESATGASVPQGPTGPSALTGAAAAASSAAVAASSAGA